MIFFSWNHEGLKSASLVWYAIFLGYYRVSAVFIRWCVTSKNLNVIIGIWLYFYLKCNPVNTSVNIVWFNTQLSLQDRTNKPILSDNWDKIK